MSSRFHLSRTMLAAAFTVLDDDDLVTGRICDVDVPYLRQAMAAGADLNTPVPFDGTHHLPLVLAAYGDSVEGAKTLIAGGARIDHALATLKDEPAALMLIARALNELYCAEKATHPTPQARRAGRAPSVG